MNNRRSLLFLLSTLIFFLQGGKAQEMPQEEQMPAEITAVEELLSPAESGVEMFSDSLEADENEAVERLDMPQEVQIQNEEDIVESLDVSQEEQIQNEEDTVESLDMPQEEQIQQERITDIENFFYPDDPNIRILADSLAANENDTLDKKGFMPDPKKAVWLSLVPGLGQIYNRKYWKLPIVYGGFMGCFYAVTWNNRTYNDYMDAYREFMDIKELEANGLIYDYETRPPKWYNYVPPGVFPEAVKGRMEGYLKRNKDSFRRYRDLSIIVTALVYFLSIIDAYVDAQLYDFDISPDLTMRVEPAVFSRTPGNNQSYGVQCNIKF